MKKRVWIGLAIAAALLFAGMLFRKEAKETLFCATLLSGEEGFSGDTFFDDAREESPYTFTLWKEQKNAAVRSLELNRSAQADVLQIYGQSRLLLPYGKNLQPEDKEGCIIGSTLAQELFGAELVEGQQLEVGRRVLTVRGVVSAPELVLIFEAEPGDETYKPDHISVSMAENSDIAALASGFTSYYGIEATAVRFDYYLYPLQLGELLPGKWSDFASWKANIAVYREALHVLGTVPKSCIEELYMKKIRRGYICLGLGLLLAAGILLSQKRQQHLQTTA